MRKLQYYGTAAFWTLAVAVPAALLALAVVAFLDRFAFEISRGLSAALRADWPGLAREASARLPEAAGMLVGQLLLLAILLLGGRRAQQINSKAG
jgi:hypothetical protein